MIRSAVGADCPAIANIAIQNNASVNASNISIEMMSSRLKADGFDCTPPRFCCSVISCIAKPETVIGYCLYYYTYSAWAGKMLNIQDLFLDKQVLDEDRIVYVRTVFIDMAQIAAKQNCARIDWFIPTTRVEMLAFAQTVNMVDITEKLNWHQYRWKSADFSSFLDQQTRRTKLNFGV